MKALILISLAAISAAAQTIDVEFDQASNFARYRTFAIRGWGTRVVRVPDTKGTLVIDLSDPTTRSLVWRGIAHQLSNDKSDAAKILSRLDDMVPKSIETYPPKPK